MSSIEGATVSAAELKKLRKAFDTGNQERILDALGQIARARGMSALASATGGARKALYDALSPAGNPRFNTLLSVLDALGLVLQVTTTAEGKFKTTPENKHDA